MTATPARIGFITRPYRPVVVINAAVEAAFGDDARDTKDEPVETWFVNPAHTTAIGNERMALVGVTGRRRAISSIKEIIPIPSANYQSVTPTVRVLDAEKDLDAVQSVVEFGLDLGSNETTIVSWG